MTALISRRFILYCHRFLESSFKVLVSVTLYFIMDNMLKYFSKVYLHSANYKEIFC